jgi:hypothetical protein
MSLRCARCHKVVETFDSHQKLVFVPHKLIDNEIYCDNCLEILEENKHFFKRVRRFLSVTKAKVILTFSLYASMLVYNIIFQKPLSEYNMVVEGFIQFGFIVNFPILIFTNHVKVSDTVSLIFLTISSILVVLLWNYLLSCILYHIYKKIESY